MWETPCPFFLSTWARRVKEHLHVILAMSPFGDALRRALARFPGLLDCCTLNWVHQWPDDALNFVSNKFLRGVEFGAGGGDDEEEGEEEGQIAGMEEVMQKGVGYPSEDHSIRAARRGEKEKQACIQLCEYFHNSTIELSKEVRRKHNLFNYVTPASFLELNSLFKSLLLEHRRRVTQTMRMYEVSLQKLRGAEGQVTVMQEEMAAIQPNLAEASQQV